MTYGDRLVEAGVIRSLAVEEAFRRVPRHRLVEEVWIPPAGQPRRLDALQHYVVDAHTPAAALLECV